MSMHKIPLSELERKGLTKHGLNIGTPSQLSDCFRHGVKWALDNYVPKWIPVSERLPGLDGGPYVSKPVLAFDKYDDVVFAKYVKSGYWVILYIDERREHGEITHWMPLPAAPEIHK